MWDNPRLLNAAAGFLVGIAALAGAASGLYWLVTSALFPLRAVELRTPLKQAPRAPIEAAMARHAQGNFFAAPVDELRAALERVPWVRRVSVRRVWPDRLEITLEEHVALARWGGEALVNVQGERFSASSDAALPQFIGPPGTEAEMARRYAQFSRLVAPLGSTLERVVLSPRLAWQLRLANGMQFTLGREGDVAERRLQRFVEAYGGTLGAAAAPDPVIDLRYPNGFALRAGKG